MDIQLHREDGGFDAVLSLNIKLVDFEEDANKALRIARQKLNLPGFRNGKVPTGIAKKYLWGNIVQEELEKVLSKSIDNYFKESKLEIIRPVLPLEQEKKIDIKNDKEFEFKYDIGIIEDIDIVPKNLLKNIKQYEIIIENKDIDEEVDRILATYGESTRLDIIEDNNDVKVQLSFIELDSDKSILEGGIEAKTYKSLDEFNKTLKALLVDQKKESSININIDEVFKDRKEFADFTNIEKLTAEDANPDFRTSILQINLQKKAELNKELFEKFTQGKAKNKEEFLNAVEEMVKNINDRQSTYFLDEEIHHNFIDKVELNLPLKFMKRLFKEENNEKIKDLSEKELEKEMSAYMKRVKWTLLAGNIAKSNNIEVSEKEIVEEAYIFISSSYMQHGVPQPNKEEMTKIISDYMKDSNNAMQMRDRVQVRKVFDFIKSDIDFKKVEITKEKFTKMQKDKLESWEKV